MIHKKFLGCAILIFISASAFAQSTWTSESTTFRTVEIGSSLSSTPECPKRRNNILQSDEYIPEYDKAYPPEATDRVCWKSTPDKSTIPNAQLLVFSNLPFIKGAGREVTVAVIDERIEAIDSQFLSQYTKTFSQALIEKYGPPSKTEQRKYQNKLGATFTGLSLSWYGKRVTLTFEEVDGSSEWGLMSMRSKKFDDALKLAGSRATESVKKGL